MVNVDFEQIKGLCQVAIENPILGESVERIISQILNRDRELEKMYNGGASILEMTKHYRAMTSDCGLMDAKYEIESRFQWPNPNDKERDQWGNPL